MSEKRFSETKKHGYHISLVFDNQTQEELGTPKVVVLLNMFEDDVQIKDKKIDEQQVTISTLKEENEQLKQKVDFYKYFQKDARELEKENEQLRKQMQNYEQLIANSYVGIEETLDGFVGKYVIWEDELQKYRKKNKNEVIDNG